MSVKFLSADYMEAATRAMAADQAFQAKIAEAELSIQFQVTGTPSGEPIDYHLTVGGGSAAMRLGTAASPDATITSSLDTATAISKGDLNVQMAVMTGRIKVDGSMAALMLNQGLIAQWGQTLGDLDIVY